MKRTTPVPGDLIICETVAAISTHYRVVTAEHPFKPSGHASPRPKTFCEGDVAWDTQLPPRRFDGTLTASCKTCRGTAARHQPQEALSGNAANPQSVADSTTGGEAGQQLTKLRRALELWAIELETARSVLQECSLDPHNVARRLRRLMQVDDAGS